MSRAAKSLSSSPALVARIEPVDGHQIPPPRGKIATEQVFDPVLSQVPPRTVEQVEKLAQNHVRANIGLAPPISEAVAADGKAVGDDLFGKRRGKKKAVAGDESAGPGELGVLDEPAGPRYAVPVEKDNVIACCLENGPVGDFRLAEPVVRLPHVLNNAASASRVRANEDSGIVG